MQNKIHTRGKNSTDKKIARPLSLTATSGDANGEIDLSWEPVASADNYLIQKSIDLGKPVKWIYEDVVTKSSYTVSKLKSGRKYWFRVAAISRRGQGKWSNSVQKQAP